MPKSDHDDIERVEEIVEELRDLESEESYPTMLQHAIRQAAGRLDSATDKARMKRRRSG